MRRRTIGMEAVAVFVLLGGCSATIQRKGDPDVQGRILRGTPATIIVQTEEDPEMAVARRQIVDIDHPGNVLATFGIFLATYGILNAVAGVSNCDEKGAAFCTGVFLPLVAGAGMMGSGLFIWGRSTSAADQTESESRQRP